MAPRSFLLAWSVNVKHPMDDRLNQETLPFEQNSDNSTRTCLLEHQTKTPNQESIPNYYEWSLCDIDSAYADLFNQMPSRLSISSRTSQLEPLSYFNYKQIDQFSLIHDRTAQKDGIYSLEHFGTSQMRRPHPMRHSIPYEESFRWMPVRSSAMIGRRSHLPLDIFHNTSKLAKNQSLPKQLL